MADESAGVENSARWVAIVQAVIDEARRHAGTGPLLAARLEELGVGGETGRYSESAISNWTKGRTMPPADALLAAAKFAGISIDQKLGLSAPGTANADGTVIEAAIGQLQAEIDRLRADVIDLYGRVGQPLPTHLAVNEPAADARRRGAG